MGPPTAGPRGIDHACVDQPAVERVGADDGSTAAIGEYVGQTLEAVEPSTTKDRRAATAR
ncbi:hypothetical protein ACZ90_54105 [Streptomyces albus subsp. albus]|nr:hypothetical protein ACZ90_54105 [Streptomyces albus subsp. albus]